MSAKDHCDTVLTIPQFTGTCWFNALLMAMFYSDGMRAFLKNHLKKSEMFKRNKELYEIMYDILFNRYRKIGNNDENFFYQMKPENILSMLHNLNTDKFYFDPSVSSGHLGEYYFVRLFEYFGLKNNVLYVNRYDRRFVYAALNEAPHIIKDPKTNQMYWGYESLPEKDMNEIHKRNVDIIVVTHLLDRFSHAKNVVFQLPRKQTDKNPIKEYLEYNGHTYKLDSLLLANFNTYTCKKSHQIAGITCENKRFLYNGWIRHTRDPARDNETYFSKDAPCELMRYDWMKNKNDFCLNTSTCGIKKVKGIQQNEMCFNTFVSTSSTYIYVKTDTIPSVPKPHEPNSNKKKECPEDKIMNPDTGRCVSKTGVIGKKLLGKPDVVPTIPDSKKKVECPGDKIMNPKTGRCVSKAGVVGKKLLPLNKKKDCPENKVLNPKTGRCVGNKKLKENIR